MADGKNAWRKMSAEQRQAFAEWIVHAEDAPELDFDTASTLRGAVTPSVRGVA
jgi:hypothetical protein